MSRCEVAASDASKERNLLATHQIITNLQNNIEIEDRVENKKWDNGMIPAREAIGILDLVSYITKRSRNISHREFVICINNKTNFKNIYKKVCKESNVTYEAGATIVAIK